MGLWLLMATYPLHDVVQVTQNVAWLTVDLQLPAPDRRELYKRNFAIWRETGNVYKVGDGGAVDNDPIITVTSMDLSGAKPRNIHSHRLY